MGRETGLLQLLTPLRLTEGKRVDLVMRGDVDERRTNLSEDVIRLRLLGPSCRQAHNCELLSPNLVPRR
jgi:predicted DNA-binding antitoxin AbrB/MazE fold protein